MIHYRALTFTHSNLKRPVKIIAGTIAGYHAVPATEATHIYTTGGIFPVSETPEQIDVIIEQLNSPQGKGTENGK